MFSHESEVFGKHPCVIKLAEWLLREVSSRQESNIMGVARNLVKSALRGAYTRVMDKLGSKLVAGMADTSSDAPDAYYAPKRDAYAQMVAEEEAQKAAKAGARPRSA